MRLTSAFIALSTIAMPAAAQDAPLDPREAFYELRVYHPHPGKLDELNARFRQHTLRIFAKHGMRNVAYWVEQPGEPAPNGKVIYVLAYPSREARDASWKAFVSDPEWLAIQSASEANGKIVAKVDSTFMSLADYSPPLAVPEN